MRSELIQALLQIDIAEIYSPVRVTGEAAKFGLKPGEAMDLTTGWDFRLPRHREAAREYQRRCKPQLLIGSPMCTMFSQLQGLSGWSEKKELEWQEAVEHIQFLIQMNET